jgi:hypothetical protein
MKHKIFAFTLLLSLIASSASPALVAAQQTLPVDPGFNPSKIIEDSVFGDTKTFGGPEGVQTFLVQRGSILANTDPAFLALLKEPLANLLKESLNDPRPNLGRTRSAAELIWDASQSAGINPQVMLVMLEKEQSLITGRKNATGTTLQRALDFSLGFGCPDSAPCGELYRGFYFQLFGNLDAEGNRYLGATQSLAKSFTTPGGRGPSFNGAITKVGDAITLDNTTSDYIGVMPQQSFIIGNAASAALYRYTPHVFNGNYNFWKFFTTWFRYPNGTLLRADGDANLYIVQNGARLTVPNFVATLRNLNPGTAVTASPNELTNYPVSGVYGLPDNTIISVDGKLYVFLNNIKRPASSFVVTQRGLNPATALTVTATDAAVFGDGAALTPSDGTIVKGQTDPAIYLVEGGVLKLFTPLTFQQKGAGKKVQTIPDAEVASYPKLGYVAPNDGALIRSVSSGAVYLIESGQKRPLSAELFKNRGFSFKNVMILPDDFVAQLATGSMPTPANNTYFKTTSGALYIFQNNTKRSISSFVASQKKITPDYTFPDSDVATWTTGVPVLPRANTIVKGSSADVYVVSGDTIRPLTAAAFKKRKITPKQITVLPQAEIDSYPKGDVLTK